MKRIHHIMLFALSIVSVLLSTATAHAAVAATKYDTSFMKGSTNLYQSLTGGWSEMIVVIIIIGAMIGAVLNQGSNFIRTACIAVVCGGVILFSPDFVREVMGRPSGMMF